MNKTTETVGIAKETIIIVGGGTGGHIMPLVAVGEELTVRQLPFIFVGSKKSREEEIVSKLKWQFVGIEAGKWRRHGGVGAFFQNLNDLSRSFRGVFQSLRIIKKYRVKTIFSKGGYVAMPMIVAARLKGCRIIIHESDAVMGVTNRLAAKFADRVLTGFEIDVYPNRDKRFRQVGIPIRRALRQSATLKSPTKSRPLLFFIGGIQGAAAINNYVKAILPRLLAKYDVVHSAGDREFPVFKKIQQELPRNLQSAYKPYDSIDRELPYYFKSADLLVSRASATVLAEAALFKKAVFLVPLPTAAGNHQVANARLLEKYGGAIMKEQYQLTAEILLEEIEKLLHNPARMGELGLKLYGYFSAEATELVIEEITNGQKG